LSFVSDYRDLLIKQYWDKPNARAEIEFKAARYEKIFNWLNSFPVEFDVDNAYGDRLDIIGKIVGIDRVVPSVIPKLAFGFSDNSNSRGFDSKFSSVADTSPFASKFSPDYTDLVLDDPNYYLFIKAKIAKNFGSPYFIDSDNISIQDAVNTLFDGSAYVVDNYDMSMNLYVSPEYDVNLLKGVLALNLLPKPQGVRYAKVSQAYVDGSFGFSDNSNSKGFSSKFDAALGGFFSTKVI
jgi:hypothetical protein